MSKEEALELLEEIEENVGVCCAITMDPDEVLVLIDKLKNQSFCVCNSDNLYSTKSLKLIRENSYDNAVLAYDRDSLNFPKGPFGFSALVSAIMCVYANLYRLYYPSTTFFFPILYFDSSTHSFLSL